MKRYLWTLTVVALLGLVGAMPLHAAPAAAPQDIRDIHGPIAEPAERPLWPWLAGGGIIAVLAAGFGLARRRRPQPLPPAERALRAPRRDTRADRRRPARVLVFGVESFASTSRRHSRCGRRTARLRSYSVI